MQVAMRREEASCKGCKWKEEVFGKEVCMNPHQTKKELRKCRFYILRGVNG